MLQVVHVETVSKQTHEADSPPAPILPNISIFGK